jgi:O-methyltransferase
LRVTTWGGGVPGARASKVRGNIEALAVRIIGTFSKPCRSVAIWQSFTFLRRSFCRPYTVFVVNIVKRLLRKCGITIVRSGPTHANMGTELEKEAQTQIGIIKKHTMLTYPRMVSLYNQAVFCEHSAIDGAFVECGVWKGGAVGLMALANLCHGLKRRNLYLFDAFDDICEPDANLDGETAIRELELLGYKAAASGRLIPIKGLYDSVGGHGTIEECRSLLRDTINYPEQNIVFVKGWFQNTLPAVSKEMEPIAILRLDGDWYASIKVCLEHLCDRVVSGGFVIIDDYGHYEGCKRAVDEYLKNKGLKRYLNYVDYSARYWIAP